MSQGKQMSKLGILTKIRLAIGILGLGYVLLVGLVQFTATETQKHMASGAAWLGRAVVRSKACFGREARHVTKVIIEGTKAGLGQLLPTIMRVPPLSF